VIWRSVFSHCVKQAAQRVLRQRVVGLQQQRRAVVAVRPDREASVVLAVHRVARLDARLDVHPDARQPQ
jgi:hypothetical protein